MTTNQRTRACPGQTRLQIVTMLPQRELRLMQCTRIEACQRLYNMRRRPSRFLVPRLGHRHIHILPSSRARRHLSEHTRLLPRKDINSKCTLLPNRKCSPTPCTSNPGTILPNTPVRPNTLPACPRSRPIAGLHDWYTIRDMSFLNFCPSCMGFLGSTRFRDYFVPNFQRDPRQPVFCAMSHPWLRVAWLQSIKQDRQDLGLVLQIAQGPPVATRPCSGSKPDSKKWYHLADPRTKRAIDNFDLCSACVRNIDLIFPKLQYEVFDRPKDTKEVAKVCNLAPNSPHFQSILSELERLSDRIKDPRSRKDYFLDFVDYVRRISRLRPCQKDTLVDVQSWHFHPNLPELTICEKCYEEVVWPLRERSIARDVSKTLKIVPTLRKGALHPGGTSCQLYSERMRRAFHDAVNKNDFDYLKQTAQHRYQWEQHCQEQHVKYERESKAGHDRRSEIEKNILVWQSIQ